MTFREQTYWCWTWSVALLLLLILFFAGAELMPHHLAHMFEILTWLIGFELALFLGLGGMLRPAMKWLYHQVFHQIALGRRFASLPGLRSWFWLTATGRDLDA
jgi:hypothetical protein